MWGAQHTPSPPSIAQDPYRDRDGAIPMSPQSGFSPSQEHFVPEPHMGKARPTAHGSPTSRKLASECGEIYFRYRRRAVCRSCCTRLCLSCVQLTVLITRPCLSEHSSLAAAGGRARSRHSSAGDRLQNRYISINTLLEKVKVVDLFGVLCPKLLSSTTLPMGLASVCHSVEYVFGFHVPGPEDGARALKDIGRVPPPLMLIQ